MKKLNILFIFILLIASMGMAYSTSVGANKQVELPKELVDFGNANNLNNLPYNVSSFSDEKDIVCVYRKDKSLINCNLVEKDNEVERNLRIGNITQQYLKHEIGMKESRDRIKTPTISGNITLTTKEEVKL